MVAKKPSKPKAAAKKAPAKRTAAQIAAHAKGRPKREGEGRPTKYRPDYHPDQAMKYCLLGCTDVRLAELFEVSEATITLWKSQHPEFSAAIKAGRDDADANISKSLYHRALGYSHKEDDIRTLSVGGGRSEIVITPTVKHYPPDTQAASLWLRNRHPERWREKVDVEHSGGLKLEQLPDAELAATMAELAKRLGMKP